MSDPDFWNAWDTSASNISSDIGTETSHELANITWSSGSGEW